MPHPHIRKSAPCSMPASMISRAAMRASAMHASFKPPFFARHTSEPGMSRIHDAHSSADQDGKALQTNNSGFPVECCAVSTELAPLASIGSLPHIPSNIVRKV